MSFFAGASHRTQESDDSGDRRRHCGGRGPPPARRAAPRVRLRVALPHRLQVELKIWQLKLLICDRITQSEVSSNISGDPEGLGLGLG